AASIGHEGIVEVLLQHSDEWDLNARDIKGNTALAWAAGKGHSMGVETLLKRRDVNPDMANYSGQTPLWLAAESGHEGVVKTLLKRSDVSPDKADTEYIQTPLLRAVLNQCEGVVKILLERKDVN
ncbi:ankyrin, partial [Choiromyces venosus 120613-1]